MGLHRAAPRRRPTQVLLGLSPVAITAPVVIGSPRWRRRSCLVQPRPRPAPDDPASCRSNTSSTPSGAAGDPEVNGSLEITNPAARSRHTGIQGSPGPCDGYVSHPRRFLVLSVPSGKFSGTDGESSQDNAVGCLDRKSVV